MKILRQPASIKLGLLLLGTFIVIGVIWVNWIMVDEVRQDARKQVEYLAIAYSDAINKSQGDDIQYVLDYLLPSISFPIIITNPEEIYAWKNIDIAEKKGTAEFDVRMRKTTARMDKEFEPLPVMWNDIEIGEIHFGDPEIVSHLQWLPYLEVGGVLIFILFGFLGFQIIRKSEKNFIWAGMARETAHQLGTPISSLLGWIKLLEEGDEDRAVMLEGMGQDVRRLGDISDRFHKIGSKPQFHPVNLKELCEEVGDYMQARISQRSGIDILVSGDAVKIPVERTLLSWAIENLVKNAIDACRTTGGEIHLNISLTNGEATIEVRDSGKGISRRDKNNIFRPGYSTKTRGWGLGLSLTRRIVEDIHDGKLRLIRSRPGETVFRIHLRN